MWERTQEQKGRGRDKPGAGPGPAPCPPLPCACPQFPSQHPSEVSRTLSTNTQDLGPR